MRLVQKVVAYIVRNGRVVAFIHPDDPAVDQSGIQVPAGTVKPDELPARCTASVPDKPLWRLESWTMQPE